MKILYNDIDPKACAWITELIKDGQIPDGDVLCKSITEITHDEIKNYDTQHYFAGIAGWPAALKQAGWPADRPVWTLSCPCPPFSCAGKKKVCPQCKGKPIPHPLKTGIFACVDCGHEWFADGRHLWPEALRLIRECKPSICIGEQVCGADGLIWLSGVRATMEALGYGFGASDLCAASVSAPHRRQRIYWVAAMADSTVGGLGVQWGAAQPWSSGHAVSGHELGDTGMLGCNQRLERNISGQEAARSKHRAKLDRSGQSDLMADTEYSERGEIIPEDVVNRNEGREEKAGGSEPHSADVLMADGEQSGLEGHAGHGDGGREPGRQCAPEDGSVAEGGPWSDYEILHFKDGKKRRIKSGISAMVATLPRGVVPSRYQGLAIDADNTAEARRMRLHGYGNAICLPLAIAFVQTVMEEFNITPEV